MGSYTHTGFWINYDFNTVTGATLTLSQRDASFMIAFLGLFVAFVGGSFWSILSFFLYHINARDRDIDFLHRGHQVILRNSETPASASWELFCLPFEWKKWHDSHGKHESPRRSPWWLYFCRSWSLSILGFLVFLAWTAAGIFSSEVSMSDKTDTLIRSNNCGTWTFQFPNSSLYDLASKLLSDSVVAAAYVKRCYGNGATSALCKSFVKQKISVSSTTNAPCPFAPGWCWNNDSAVLQLDTGFIDSHNDLGINAPLDQRVKFRRVSTCSVIPSYPNGDHSFINETNSSAGSVVRYWYGPIDNTTGINWTFEYYKAKMLMPLGYELNTVVAKRDSEETSWKPIPQLNTSRATGDVALIYLFPNNIVYPGPIDDPFFTSHKLSELYIEKWFTSDNYTHVMGCVDQYQFCNSRRWNDSDIKSCTPLTGAFTARYAIQFIGYSPEQLATATRIQEVVARCGGLDSSVSGRGNVALQANEYVYHTQYGSIQGPLSDNQWVIEVSNWFDISLAKLQRAIVEFAAGPVNLPPGGEVITPVQVGWPIMCDRQKVANSGAYQNFSVVALSVILGVGGSIIIISWTIEPCVNYLRQKRNPDSYKQFQWTRDSKLQLQHTPYHGEINGHLRDV